MLSLILKCDVLINTIANPQSKKLVECGIIAATFYKVCGKKLQDDFKKLVKRTGGLKPGNVLVSSACAKLNSKLVIHLGIERWTSTSGNEVMVLCKSFYISE